ncbi:MAG: GNAT family N-acetyltransferase [Saprospiraceae bacterium]
MTNKEAYYQFCKKEKEIPLFSQSWYLDAICGEKGWDILMITKGNEIAATMPILREKQFGFSLSRMPLITPYLGPYFTKKFRSFKQQEKLMRALIKQLPSFDLFEQNFPLSIKNWLPFYWEGFEATVRYSFLIDLEENLEKIYQNIDSDYRNNKLPKAEKLIRIISDRSLEDFFYVHEKTFTRQGLSSPFSFDFLKKYDDAMSIQNTRIMFFAVDKKNQIHSVVYLIWDEDTAYFVMAGDDPEFRNSGAGSLIVWHAIKYAKEVLGKKRFDFMGSVIEPITRVRRNFGGKQVPYFRVKKFESKLLEIIFQLKN